MNGSRVARLFGVVGVLASLGSGGIGCEPADAPGSRPSDPTIVEGEAARTVDRFLAAQADSGFNGSVLIAREDRILLHKSYGWADRNHSRPVTNETPFWIASVSKQFAAAAVLVLTGDGVLSPADSIARFFDFIPADKRGITLHQLMTHTAGLTQRYAADGITGRDDAVRAVLDTLLAYPPGTDFDYSNDAYTLVAAIVEVASGKPFESFVQERVLNPAGLRETGFWGPSRHPEVAAILGDTASTPGVGEPNWGFRGATGMYSTAGDLYRWHRALQEGRVLPDSGLHQLQGAFVSRQEITVGYGWFTSPTPQGTRSVWTRGYESFGHGAHLATYPDEHVAIVILSNSGERDGRPVTHRLSMELERLVFAPSPSSRS